MASEASRWAIKAAVNYTSPHGGLQQEDVEMSNGSARGESKTEADFPQKKKENRSGWLRPLCDSGELVARARFQIKL